MESRKEQKRNKRGGRESKTATESVRESRLSS